MDLRPLTSADLDGLETLIALSEAEGFHFLKRITREFGADPAYFDSDRSLVLGACDGARLVAVGGLTPDPYIDDPTVGRIRHVYVASAYRRGGIGRRLITALEGRARKVYVYLRLRTDTASGAAFYVDLAYRPVVAATATHMRAFAAEGVE